MRDPLREALIAFGEKLQPEIQLIVGGGYGLVLRHEYIRASNQRTRRPSIPTVRSTEDIDLFLGVEIITDGTLTGRIRNALDSLGYVPIVEHFQFGKTILYEEQERQIKIDFLAAPPPVSFKDVMKVKEMRMRPKSFGRLHAYITPEALTIEESVLRVPVGKGPSGSEVVAYLPHAFSFLLLKLFALRDRLADPEDADGKYHALDMFTIWSMMTESEWEDGKRFRAIIATKAIADDIAKAVHTLFLTQDAPGRYALLEQGAKNGVRISSEDQEAFITDLQSFLIGSSQPEKAS
jgi:hypothetical protein